MLTNKSSADEEELPSGSMSNATGILVMLLLAIKF
jgi:hypothetical protein